MTPPHRTTERPIVVDSSTDPINMEPSPVDHNNASSTSPAPPSSAELADAGYIDDVTTTNADAKTTEKAMATSPVDEKVIAISIAPSLDKVTAADEKVTKTTIVAAATTEDVSLVSDIKTTDETATTTAALIVAVSVSDVNIFFFLYSHHVGTYVTSKHKLNVEESRYEEGGCK